MVSTQKGMKKYSRRELGKMSVEGVVALIQELETHKRPMSKDMKTGFFNTQLNAFKVLWGMIGGDAGLLDEESRKTVLEQMQGIFEGETKNCPDCGVGLVCPWCSVDRSEWDTDGGSGVTIFDSVPVGGAGNTVESTRG